MSAAVPQSRAATAPTCVPRNGVEFSRLSVVQVMNSARAALIAILFSLGAALIIASANAQSSSATPTTSAPVGSIPEKIPPNWAANGSDQASWTAMREHCRAVFAIPNKFSHSEWEGCVHLSSAFSSLPEPPLTPSLPPLAAAPGNPTPLPTPLPPAPPVT